MIERTEEEVVAMARELWPGTSSINKSKLKVTKLPDSGWRVEVSQMYSTPEMSARVLFALADFFGTRNISEESDGFGGCETCDYGSKYSLRIEIRD